MGARQQFSILQEAYPDATYYLNWDTPFHLVLATILSAQCRDTVVNATTPALFAKYKTPNDVQDEEELAEVIRNISFYKAKAGYIVKACKTLREEFGGEVPKEIKQLTKLSGVGKKTANAIQQNAFDMVNGIVVDTHVIRLSQRIGWTKEKNPEKIEQDLMKLFPKDTWKSVPHVLKNHGQQVCTARAPKCSDCPLNDSCKSAFKV